MNKEQFIKTLDKLMQMVYDCRIRDKDDIYYIEFINNSVNDYGEKALTSESLQIMLSALDDKNKVTE